MVTDITELAKSLKAAAENAGADCWQAKKISSDFYIIRKGSYKRECGYTTYQPIAEIDHKPTRDYVAMANPTNILALVEALEKSQKRIAELESRTVKLPDSNNERFWGYGAEFEIKLYDSCVFHALTTAGIKWEVE